MTLNGLKGRRLAIIGNSGSGKSTLAKSLSVQLSIPHIELDALNWQRDWRALSLEDPEAWYQVVGDAIVGDAWITDGNYSKGALPQILSRATDVVWLDYTRAVIMVRVLKRSFWRALAGQELWAGTGNREHFGRWLRKDHPIRWTWDTFASANEQREERFSSPELTQTRKHRLRTPKETQKWVRSIAASHQDCAKAADT